jgi:hypothetical protein
MSFAHPSCAAIVILKWSSIMEKKSMVFSIAVTMSVEYFYVIGEDYSEREMT